MLIETHAHLDFPDYKDDRDDVIRRANDAGVGIIINVSSNLKGSFSSVELSRQHDCIYAACGIHPHDAKDVTDETIQSLKGLITSSDKVVAIGEVGLDFYRNLSPHQLQIDAFVKFIRLAKELKLPLILHCREEAPGKKEASGLLIKSLRENLDIPVRAVMHCFSGDEEMLKQCLDLGMYISFTCNVTFKNAAKLREVLKAVPVERLLLETDAPFLAPEGKRGQRNEPAYLRYLLEAISENLGISKDEVERITTENAKNLFGIRI
ncbi:MAG: TatD family hydrolase [Candidatus Omnitrophica bacterium]|nr:TatD family hydrolase [Candidatus Omnitrophota bacterium]